MNFLISAGDPSGDLYGSRLIPELKKLRPEARFVCAGGELMRRACGAKDAFLCDLASHGLTGFFAPLKKIPTLLRLRRRMSAAMRSGEIDRAVCIDFYGFNRHVLSAAKSAGVPAHYFISPQVWASRAGRIKHIKACVERMLVIFPFEEKLYRDAGVPVSWVGHPLLDILPPPASAAASGELKIGLLPGSRKTEIRRHLPLFLKAVRRIRKDYPAAAASVFAAPQLPDAFYARWLKGREAVLVRESDYALRSRQDIVLTSSGTATLENALLGLPMVVVYKLAWPTYWIARALIRVPYIAMANLLAGEKLVPELIQGEATAEKVAAEALAILHDPRVAADLRGRLSALREKLGGPGATSRAARALCASAPAPLEKAA